MPTDQDPELDELDRFWRAARRSAAIAEWDRQVRDSSPSMGIRADTAAPSLADAPPGRDRLIVACIDERIPDDLTEAGPDFGPADRLVRLAGSGVRNPAVLHALAYDSPQLYGAAIAGLTSHSDCGAAAIEAAKLGHPDAESFAVEFARSAATALGLPYLGHLGPDVMRPWRPSFHHAVGAIYDGTGRLRRRKGDPTFQSFFAISRRAFGPYGGAATDELAVTIRLAQGPTGFGLRRPGQDFGFSDETPFYIVVLGDPDQPLLSPSRLLAEAASVAAQFPAVRVVAPSIAD